MGLPLLGNPINVLFIISWTRGIPVKQVGLFRENMPRGL